MRVLADAALLLLSNCMNLSRRHDEKSSLPHLLVATPLDFVTCLRGPQTGAGTTASELTHWEVAITYSSSLCA